MTTRKYIKCSLPPGHERWFLPPFPGSQLAVEQGCTCPDTQPWPGSLIFASDCPLHALEHVKQ